MQRSSAVATRPPAPLQPGPITLYAQLASILRDRIMTGLWKAGEEIPTLEQLVQEFSVARVTVRQAVQILVEEGLLSSQRGRRTCVTVDATRADGPLFSSTGADDGVDTTSYSIEVLSHQVYETVPPQYAGLGSARGPYMRIRKLDGLNGQAYTVSDNYIAMDLYKRFPAGAEHQVKVSRLVRDNAYPARLSGLERTTIGLATYEEANCLQVPVGSPVAHVTRAFFAPDNHLIYLGVLVYRGDRFYVERDVGYALSRNGREAALASDPGPLLAGGPSQRAHPRGRVT
jgi:GntR family transcriptional regulator